MTEKNKTQEIITEASSQGLTVKQRVQIGNRRSVKRRRNFVLPLVCFAVLFALMFCIGSIESNSAASAKSPDGTPNGGLQLTFLGDIMMGRYIGQMCDNKGYDRLFSGISGIWTITRADFYGFVVPFVNELMRLSREAKIPVRIRACDTMGYGVPYTEVDLPRSVPGIIYGLQHYADVQSEMLEWHGHNDFYKAVANASTAWLYGASGVNCSLLGIGERTGNVPLEAMVFEYASLKGSLDGMNPTVITEIAEYFKRNMGYKIPPMTPFVGKNFNVTRAGIHADGLLKDEEIYNIFDTKKLLNRPASVMISKTSGLAGIAYWMNQNYDLSGDDAIDKRDPLVAAVKQWVDSEYEGGRTASLSTDELERKIEELSNGKYKRV